MAKDTELDRLKSAQDLAYQRKQTAYDKQQRAWEKRSKARDVMNRAHDAKQRAYDEQDRTWQQCQRVRSANGPRIDSLNTQQEQAYQNMVRAFESSRSAWDRGDRAGAASYAEQGRGYKAESQGYVAERRKLVEEIRSARGPHDSAKTAFQRSKAEFDSCKRVFDSAKSEHERAAKEFQQAKAEFDVAVKAFQVRLDTVKKSNAQKRDDDRAIAMRAGVSAEYLGNIKVRKNNDGSYDIFYGGISKPDGFGHGHAALSRTGKATHDRKPFDANRPENFADDEAYIDFQKSKGHGGGWGLAHYGYIDGKPVTFVYGWGTKEGETLLADGHVDKSTFHRSQNHNHYGSGQGPHGNAKDRGRYTGRGA